MRRALAISRPRARAIAGTQQSGRLLRSILKRPRLLIGSSEIPVSQALGTEEAAVIERRILVHNASPSGHQRGRGALPAWLAFGLNLLGRSLNLPS
jgi:hypothetical protein